MGPGIDRSDELQLPTTRNDRISVPRYQLDHLAMLLEKVYDKYPNRHLRIAINFLNQLLQ